MIYQIAQTILTYVQPVTVIGFLISGLCCVVLALKTSTMWSIAIINLSLVIVNLFIFYGNKIFK